MKKFAVPLLAASLVVFGLQACSAGAGASGSRGVPEEVLQAVQRLASDPSAVATENAEYLEDDGYFEGIPRGSVITVTENDWFAYDDGAGSF